MITSDKQYNAAMAQVKMLNKSLDEPFKQGVPEIVQRESKSQIQSLIAKINKNIQDYESLKSCHLDEIEIHSLNDLWTAPIRYRIAAKMSVDKFGQKVGVSPRQIMRYEKEEYKNANTSTINKILEKLDLKIDGRITGVV